MSSKTPYGTNRTKISRHPLSGDHFKRKNAVKPKGVLNEDVENPYIKSS